MRCTAKRCNQEISSIALPLVLIVFFMLTGIRSGQTQSNAGDYPGKWKAHNPGGETSCGDGSEFKYFTHKANSSKLLVYFTGGGACWTGQQCNTEADPTPYAYNLTNNDPRNKRGIFNLSHPENPFTDYTMVYVPTCTGDVVMGDSVATYRYQAEDGPEKTVTIHHKGYQNGRSVLNWVYESVDDPETIVVSGSSAGGLATPFYANIIANHYPEARVVSIGDAAGAYRKSATEKADLTSWNMEKAYNNHEAFSNLNSQNIGIEKLYMSAANRQLTNLELYQVDQAYDNSQHYFLRLAGTEDPDVSALIQTNRSDIRNSDPEFRSFMIGGREHTVLARSLFYYYRSDGILFRDWLDKIVKDKSVESVQCQHCRQPDFKYTQTDQSILKRMDELLSTEDHWNSDDDFENNPDCSESKEAYSLRCSLVHAAKEVERSPADYPVTYEILYEIRDRLDEYHSNDRVIVKFNNQEGRTFQDIKDLIKHVKNEIDTQFKQ